METPIKKRLSMPMPEDWKKIQKFCFAIGLILTAISGSLVAVMPDSLVMKIVTAVAGTFTAVSTALAALTVDKTTDEETL